MALQKLALSEREERWDDAAKVYWGHKYDHLPPWSKNDVKLRKKQPMVQIRMTALAIDTGNNYLFGEEQSPSFSIDGDEQGTLELQELTKAAGISRHFKEMGRVGLLQGTTGLAFHKFDGGRWDSEMPKLQAADATFGTDDRARAIELGIDFDDLLELDERWRTVERPTFGRGKTREILHRRRWTPDEVVEYEPLPSEDVIDLLADDEELPWRVDEERSRRHELGFVPVEWIPNGEVQGDSDGRPIVTHTEWLIEDAVNYALSQALRGVEYNGEPWLAFLNTHMGDEAIKRGAGRTLEIKGSTNGAGADAKLLEMSGAGQQTAVQLIMLLRQAFFEVAQIVVHDPQKFGGALSGTALMRLLQPTIMLIKGLRPLYGKHISRLLRKMWVAENGGSLADAPDITAVWPDIVHPTDDERSARVMAVGDAHDRNYITYQTAVEQVAGMFGVENAGQYINDLRAENGQGGTATELDPEAPDDETAGDNDSPFEV